MDEKLTADGRMQYDGTITYDPPREYVWLDRAQAAVDAARKDRDEALQRAKRAEKLLAQDLKKRTERPDFKTYVELKHGTAGAILWALQNGEISRGKAAEALAEWAHGVEPLLPDLPDAIPDDVTPSDLLRERDEARARAEEAKRTIQMLNGFVDEARSEADAVRAEAKRLREALEAIRTPSAACIDSMALRYNHAFGLLGEQHREAIRSQMRQLHEEATGRGFHFIPEVAAAEDKTQRAQPAAPPPQEQPVEPADELAQLLEPLQPNPDDWMGMLCYVSVANDRLAKLRAHIAGEPARTRAAVVAELRHWGDVFLGESTNIAVLSYRRSTMKYHGERLHRRADELEREGVKEVTE